MKRLALLCGAMLLFAGLASAQDSPKIEAFGGYSYLRANADGVGYNFNGGSGSLAYNLTPWLGVVGDFGGYHWSGSGENQGVDSTLVTYLFGPKVSYRHGPITPFAQVLLGGAHISATDNECEHSPHSRKRYDSCGSTSGSQNGFSMALGGGLDWNATSHIGIRLIQAEYLMTRFDSQSQNNARISTGVVFRF